VVVVLYLLAGSQVLEREMAVDRQVVQLGVSLVVPAGPEVEYQWSLVAVLAWVGDTVLAVLVHDAAVDGDLLVAVPVH